jgi:hypothetical protein
MKEWGMLHDGSANESDPQVVHYHQVRGIWGEQGEIELLHISSQAAIVLLAGLFVGNYFKRRRRAAALAILKDNQEYLGYVYFLLPYSR